MKRTKTDPFWNEPILERMISKGKDAFYIHSRLKFLNRHTVPLLLNRNLTKDEEEMDNEVIAQYHIELDYII